MGHFYLIENDHPRLAREHARVDVRGLLEHVEGVLEHLAGGARGWEGLGRASVQIRSGVS